VLSQVWEYPNCNAVRYWTLPFYSRTKLDVALRARLANEVRAVGRVALAAKSKDYRCAARAQQEFVVE